MPKCIYDPVNHFSIDVWQGPENAFALNILIYYFEILQYFSTGVIRHKQNDTW